MLAHALQGLGFEEGISMGQRKLVAAHKIGELHVVSGILRVFFHDAAGTDVVEVVQQLGRVSLDSAVWVNLLDGFNRLVSQSYVIEIGGADDVKVGFGIDNALSLMLIQTVHLFFDAIQARLGALAVVVEEFVLRFSLAETHVLNVGHEHLYEVIGLYAVKQFVGPFVVHPPDVVESQIVQGFSSSCPIAVGQCQCPLCIVTRRV